jgi:PAS domain S-box-containing protein
MLTTGSTSFYTWIEAIPAATEGDLNRCHIAVIDVTRAQYRAIFREAKDGIVLTDAKTGNVVNCNPEFEKQTGRTREQLSKMKIWQVRPPEKMAAAEQRFHMIRKAGGGSSSELDFQKPNGDIVPVEFTSKLVTIQGRTLLQSMVRDITERKQMEHDIGERLKELQCLYSISQISARAEISLNEVYQEVSNLLPPSWQYPEITCSRIIINENEFRTENYRDTDWRLCADITMRGEKIGMVEVGYLEDRPAIDEGPFLKEERALINAVAKHLAGIIQRKQEEDGLHESERKYLSLFNNILNGYAYCRIVVDENNNPVDFVCLEINDAFEKMIGLRRENVIGRKVTEAISGIRETNPELFDIFGKVALIGEPTKFDTYLKPLSIWLAISAYSPQKDYFIAVLENITEHKKVDQMKDDFIGLISHELRSPLTVIMGGLNTILSEGNHLSSQERNQLLYDAILETESLSHLVSNLLELTQAQSGRLMIHAEAINLSTLASGVVEQIKEQSESHRFVVSIPKKLPLLFADLVRLERILYNLVRNAVNYSPHGSEVKVFAKLQKEHIMIGVRDQGGGISTENQARIFQPFQRLGDPRQEVLRGVGLGLVVCRYLVEAHNGKIWVESKLGEGATFYLKLPIRQQ